MRQKPGRWSVNPADIAPEYRSIWRGLSYGFSFWGEAERLFPFYRNENLNDDQGVMPSGWTWQANETGTSLNMDGSGQMRIASSYGGVATEASVLWVGHGHTAAITRIWGVRDNFEIRQDASGFASNELFQAGASEDATVGTSSIISSDHSVDHVIIATAAYSSGGGPSAIWVDGVREATSNFANELPASGNLFLGGRATPYGDACMSLFVHWDRVLGDGEIALLSRDPFGLIRLEPGVVYDDAIAFFNLTDMPSDFGTADHARLTVRARREN